MAQQQQPQQPGTPPTPAGQAGAGTNGPNTPQLVMQMMAIVQLTQGQTQLNQAMTEAMNQQLQINRNVERSVEYKDRSELKGIPKPDKFNGASGTWDSWWYKFKTWVESCHKNAVKIVAQVEAQCDKEITELNLEVDFDDGAELVSAQARQALISLTEGEALEIVKNTSRGSHFGLEAMRRLLCKYDPQNPQANSALLKKVLHPSQCSLEKLREGLESWENLKRKYQDRRKKPLEDDICRSCLQQMCPNKLQDHLDFQASRLTSYEQVKSEVLAYLENVETRKEAKSGAVPMDVDSLAKSKGKGKSDKGKGKGKSKGKDKGKNYWTSSRVSSQRVSNPRVSSLGVSSHGISSLGKRTQTKAKARQVKTKAKAKAIKVKVVKLQLLSPMLGLKIKNLQFLLVINLNQKLLLCTLLKKLCRPSQRSAKNLVSQSLIVFEVPDEQHYKPLPKEQWLEVQCYWLRVPWYQHHGELFGKMISRAEKAVEEAKEKGIEANQALKDRQEALAQLKAEAEQNRAEVKGAMAKVRAEGRATSAPAEPSRRLRADLEAGVRARAAKKADKDRQRAASHRAATGRDRAASWKRFEHAVHDQDDPDRWDRDDMGDIPEPPKPRKLEPKRHRGGHHRSERRRQDEARKKENLAKMSEMKGERTPPWVHDRYEKSETESATASGEDDLVNRLDCLQQDPAVRHKLDKVLKEAYEETYGEPLDLDSPEMVESDFDVPMVDEPAPGMEDVVHHWEIAQKKIMQKSKTVSRMGHPYVKCQWKSPELYVHYQLLATCGKQAVLSSKRSWVLEERASSKESRGGVF